MSTQNGESTARIRIHPDPVATVDRRLFGTFVEHMGRGVYTGLYEPGHPEANDAGFRQDVTDLVAELGVTHVRYPGGNFVSGFEWEDSVGPVEDRPRRLNLAWHSLETNEVGLHEFDGWRKAVGIDLSLTVNLGTRGISEAVDLIEYCNVAEETRLTKRRVANGAVQPIGVTTWFLGNEMDGPWQIGHRSAEDYGALASRTAKAMRLVEPNIDLVLAGSSHHSMPTFGTWERTVLAAAYEDVDYISCHAYYEVRDGDRVGFLESGVEMDRYIKEVVEICDAARDAAGGEKDIMISFDEWNVWYLEKGLQRVGKQTEKHYRTDEIKGDDWPIAPRLSEDPYTVVDAVVVGDLLATLIRNADRVKTASLSMLVNVMAPIMTEPNGPAWRQTTFYPFALTARLAGDVLLDSEIEAPTYESATHGTVSVLSVAATESSETGMRALFLVNRSEHDALTVTIEGEGAIVEAWTLSDVDPAASNTLAEPMRVTPTATEIIDRAVLRLPPLSWTAAIIDGDSSAPRRGQ